MKSKHDLKESGRICNLEGTESVVQKGILLIDDFNSLGFKGNLEWSKSFESIYSNVLG